VSGQWFAYANFIFSQEAFEEQVAGTCLKNSNQFEFVGLVAETKL